MSTMKMTLERYAAEINEWYKQRYARRTPACHPAKPGPTISFTDCGACVYFRSGKVEHSEYVSLPEAFAVIDFDAAGEIIGVEIV